MTLTRNRRDDDFSGWGWGLDLAENMELLGCDNGSIAAKNERVRACIYWFLFAVNDTPVRTLKQAEVASRGNAISLCFQPARPKPAIPGAKVGMPEMVSTAGQRHPPAVNSAASLAKKSPPEGVNEDAIARLRKAYHSGFAFPKWVRTDHPAVPLHSYDWSGVEAYYPDDCDSSRHLAEARRVVAEREPANVEMRRCYDEEFLRMAFGYQHSRYSVLWKQKNSLAPNVAVYCRTPVAMDNGSWDEPLYVPTESVHVINVIAPAFDSEAQPDWQYFFGGPRPIRPELRMQLRELFAHAFRCIFVCAQRHRLRCVCLSLFGCNNFAALYRGGEGRNGRAALFSEIYLPALRATLRIPGFLSSLVAGGVTEVSVFGMEHDTPQLNEVCSTAGLPAS
eukprot:gene58099-biopygen44560